MKFLLISFLLAVTLSSVWSAICVELCSTHIDVGAPPCPPGFECRSNGCGHTCQPALMINKRQRCPMLNCLPCPNGYEVDEHGCQTCKCQSFKRALSLCPMVMCAMFCENGFRTGPDGCPLCSCA